MVKLEVKFKVFIIIYMIVSDLEFGDVSINEEGGCGSDIDVFDIVI